MRALAARAAAESDENAVRKWWRMEFAMFLADATGQRASTLQRLVAADFSLDATNGFAEATLTVRPESIKMGYEVEVPLPVEVAAECHRHLARLGVVGRALVFPQQRDDRKHLGTDQLSQWLHEVEREAGLPPIKGGVWHPFRRKWRTDRDGQPLAVVMQLGAWKDIGTAMRYSQPDRSAKVDTMRAATLKPGGDGVTPRGAAWAQDGAEPVGASARPAPTGRHDPKVLRLVPRGRRRA